MNEVGKIGVRKHARLRDESCSDEFAHAGREDDSRRTIRTINISDRMADVNRAKSPNSWEYSSGEWVCDANLFVCWLVNPWGWDN